MAEFDPKNFKPADLNRVTEGSFEPDEAFNPQSFEATTFDKLIPKTSQDYVVPEWVGKMSDEDKLFKGVKDRLGVMKRALTSPFLSNEAMRNTSANLFGAVKPVLNTPTGYLLKKAGFDPQAVEQSLTSGGAKKTLDRYAKEREQYLTDELYVGDDPYYMAGDIGTGVVTGMGVPFYKGASVLGTAAKQFLPNALFEAATNEGDISDRLKAGVKGGVGAAAGTAAFGAAGKAGRVIAPRIKNKVTGAVERSRWQFADDIAKQDLADAVGAPLSLGDITGGPLNVVRKAEDWFPGKFNREPVLNAQAEALIAKLHPKNQVQEGMKVTSEALKQKADDIFAPVNAKIGKTSLLVPTDNMHSAVKELRDRFPSLFTTEIKDMQTRDLLNGFADEVSPPALSFDEFTKIRQAIGRVSSLAKGLGVKGGNTDYDQAYKLSKSAYAKAMNDVESWGSIATGTSKKTAAKYKDIVDEWKYAMEKWKKDILPFEDNQFYSKVMDPDITPEQTLNAVLDPMMGTARDRITGPYLKEYSPETQKLFDTVKLMNRAAKHATTSADEHGSHILDTLITIGHPGIVGAQTGLSKGSASPLLKDIVLSKFDDMLPTTGFAGVPTSLGREYGDIPSIGGLGILNYLMNVGGDDDMPISSQTQIGAQGR